MTKAASIARISELDTRFQPMRWRWAEENRTEIERFWRDAVAAKPKMFNGRVLLAGSQKYSPNRVEATYFETDFASFRCWVQRGFPDTSVANGFALAALRCADGAFICGVMGEHTANSGMIYFPGGTPDPSDIRSDGTVDFLGSALRELDEETGLKASDVELENGWICVQEGEYSAYLKPMLLPGTAEDTVERLIANLARQKEPELSGFHIVRSMADVDAERMPSFLQAFFLDAFAG